MVQHQIRKVVVNIVAEVRLPVTLDEALDSRWVQSALRTRSPNVVVDSVEIRAVTHASATHARLTVRYESGRGGLHEDLYLKGSFETDVEHRSMQAAGLYLRESMAYRDLLPATGLRVPDCYYAGYDSTTKHGVVLLADVVQDGSRLGSALRPYSEMEVKSFLAELAKLHGHYWEKQEATADGDIHDLAVIAAGLAAGGFDFFGQPADVLDEAFGRNFAVGVPESVRDGNRLTSAIRKLVRGVPGETSTLIHGDPHAGNLFLRRDGAPGFFDWQTLQVGSWAMDVSYLLISSMSVEDRRRAAPELIRHYGNCLARETPRAPSHEALWNDFVRWVLYGFYVWVLSPLQMKNVEQQTPSVEAVGDRRSGDVSDAYGFGWNLEVATAFLSRFGAAVEDYGVLEVYER